MKDTESPRQGEYAPGDVDDLIFASDGWFVSER